MKFVAGESEILWHKTIKLDQAPSRGLILSTKYSKNANSWDIQSDVGIPCPS